MIIRRVLIFVAILGLIFFCPLPKPSEGPCAFCKQEIIDAQAFYEDELVIGMLNYQPIVPGHVMIIPKRHVGRFEELTEDEVLAQYRLLKRLIPALEKVYGTPQYLQLQKNGWEVGQTISHVHTHIIAREKGRRLNLYFFLKFALRDPRPMSADDLKKESDAIRQALSESELAERGV